MKRKGIGKRLRFSIFTRDKFTCRYCGRQSDLVPLCLDHIIPVAKGGTDDEANLITSCVDCNSGKSDKLLEQAAPTEEDRLRMLQEGHEQLQAARAAQAASDARAEFRQTICNFWCEANGTKDMDVRTLSVMCRYAEQHGVEMVYKWIEMAAERVASSQDYKKGMYISGIRRRMIEDGELSHD